MILHSCVSEYENTSSLSDLAIFKAAGIHSPIFLQPKKICFNSHVKDPESQKRSLKATRGTKRSFGFFTHDNYWNLKVVYVKTVFILIFRPDYFKMRERDRFSVKLEEQLQILTLITPNNWGQELEEEAF